MDELRDDHSIETSKRVVGDEDHRSVIRRDILRTLNGSRTSELFTDSKAYELIIALLRMTTQESVHLLDMRDSLKVPNQEVGHVRLGRFAL